MRLRLSPLTRARRKSGRRSWHPLYQLARTDVRQPQIVELRFFAGMTLEQVAEHFGLSKHTLEPDWTAARTWLRQKLSSGDSG